MNASIRRTLLIIAISLHACNSGKLATWEVIRHEDMAHAAAIESIVFDINGEGWVLTWAELSKVDNNGRDWTPILTNEGGRRAFYGLAFTDPASAFVVGTEQKSEGYTALILRTLDGGKTWREMPTDVRAEPDRNKRPALHSISLCGDQTGWSVGENLILHTKDGGESWQTQRDNVTDGRLFSVACVSAQRAWAVGTGGLLLRTVDGGATWTTHESHTKDDLMRVRFAGEVGWIVGGADGRGVVLRTIGSGESWQVQKLQVEAGLFDIFQVGDSAWISGEKGTILRSRDRGQSWLPEKTPTNENITSLFFISPNHGWAGADRKTLLRFSD
ncbi:MAG TPA: YCF48-related protein [Pyrinomonadaceae bacterium]|nr:YCF48-related protein [Pyrinomonadaceae bacterium]